MKGKILKSSTNHVINFWKYSNLIALLLKRYTISKMLHIGFIQNFTVYADTNGVNFFPIFRDGRYIFRHG